jgi:hypothetical protein
LLGKLCGTAGRGGGVDVGAEAGVVAAAGSGGGVSVFGVSLITSVLGCTVLFRGEPVATTLASGVPGRELRDATLNDGARDVLWRSIFELAEGGGWGESCSLCSTFEGSGVVSKLSLPGCGLFELDAGASAFFSGDDFAEVTALDFTSSATLFGALTGVFGATGCAGTVACAGT